MSVNEYKIACNLDCIDPSIENGQFLHWLITADGDCPAVVEKVHNAIVNAIRKKYLLDFTNEEQCSYFCDAIRDIVLKDRKFVTDLLEAVLKIYKGAPSYGAEVFNYCKRLNKAIGFTAVEYFKRCKDET